MERLRKANVVLFIFQQHGGVRGLVYPHGHYGKRPLQVSREYPASEDQVRVSSGRRRR